MTRACSRRRFLQTGATLGATAAASLAGRLDSPVATGAVVAADPGVDVPDGGHVVDMATVSRGELQILQTAIEEGFYHECEISDPTEAFVDRLGDDPRAVYLARADHRYGLWVRVRDLVHAMTADRPDGVPDCGTLL